MAQICVKIDLHRLGLRLGQDNGRALRHWEIQQWLSDHKFQFKGDWFCDEGGLRHLLPNEIIQVTRTVTEGGVTFINHSRATNGQKDEDTPTNRTP